MGIAARYKVEACPKGFLGCRLEMASHALRKAAILYPETAQEKYQKVWTALMAWPEAAR